MVKRPAIVGASDENAQKLRYVIPKKGTMIATKIPANPYGSIARSDRQRLRNMKKAFVKDQFMTTVTETAATRIATFKS